MIQEHALRKLEFFLHHYSSEKDIKPILDNILKAADRGYSYGTYNICGHFVTAPQEDFDKRVQATSEELLWPFSSERIAQHFLAHLNHYFEVRGTRAEVLGVEGFVVR